MPLVSVFTVCSGRMKKSLKVFVTAMLVLAARELSYYGYKDKELHREAMEVRSRTYMPNKGTIQAALNNRGEIYNAPNVTITADNKVSGVGERLIEGNNTMNLHQNNTVKTMASNTTNTSASEELKTSIMNFFHISDESKRDPLLNLHKFAYDINSAVCKKHKPDIITFIHSATKNYERRMLVRNTWGTFTVIRGFTLSHVFMVARAYDKNVQKKIDEENETYGDIVQGQFIDSYRNLTYKHVMGIHWVLSNCPSAKLIVKADDDVLINVFNLVEYISKTDFRQHFLYCELYYDGLTRREKLSKWYVKRRDYPFDNYPTYCSGMAYLMSPDVARELYKASENTRFYWVDDVYVTGILALKVNPTFRPMVEHHDWRQMKNYYRRHMNQFMFLLGTRLWETLWKATLKVAPENWKSKT
ncbi:beta-1,3-galactosyltransferase 5-like [Haliotis rubra]|uniref:beta-1,3-galactosyltransferase 5-like n=1 Tax=Haliotis rubra TaxID=36100 RepID=UPI001EE5C9DC|nr:beta-1,3-galactosyltransferase 5-like [Haliotis rubra]